LVEQYFSLFPPKLQLLPNKKGSATLGVVIGFIGALPYLLKCDFQPKKEPKYPLSFALKWRNN
jgi:hypothetical protein